MTFAEFERRARQVFAEIPPEFRAGVEALTVVRKAVPHPSLPDVYTLGECATGEYDPAYDGPGVRSQVILYYGSFQRLSQLDEGWSWDEEIWETITHEIRHHRESTAGEDALEDVDYAEDQNFARLEGEAFDPFFYRSGEPVAPGAWTVDGEVFVERVLAPAEWDAAAEVEAAWDGGRVRIPRPDRLGDVHLVTVEGTPEEEPPVTVVLVRRRGFWEQVRGLLSTAPPEVLESACDALPADGGGGAAP
jgi:hypothetical protein